MTADQRRWWTDETTRFVVETKSVCERCGNDGWGVYKDQRRCHACGRIVVSDEDEVDA